MNTLQIDSFDEDAGMYTGTIVVDGEPMRVWVPDDMAFAYFESQRSPAEATDVPF